MGAMSAGQALIGIFQRNALNNMAHANDDGLYIPIGMMAPIQFSDVAAGTYLASGGARIIVSDAMWYRLSGEILAIRGMTGRELGSVPFYHNAIFGEQMGKHFVYAEGGLLDLGEKGPAGLQGRARSALAEWKSGRTSIQEIIRDNARLRDYFIAKGEQEGLENGGTRWWNGVHPDMTYGSDWYRENGFYYKKFPSGPGPIPAWRRPFQ